MELYQLVELRPLTVAQHYSLGDTGFITILHLLK